MAYRNEDLIDATIAELKKFNLSLIIPGHCTGWRAVLAGNIGVGRLDPDSPAIGHALRRLEGNTKYAGELFVELTELQRTARTLFNQSEWRTIRARRMHDNTYFAVKRLADAYSESTSFRPPTLPRSARLVSRQLMTICTASPNIVLCGRTVKRESFNRCFVATSCIFPGCANGTPPN